MVFLQLGYGKFPFRFEKKMLDPCWTNFILQTNPPQGFVRSSFNAPSRVFPETEVDAPVNSVVHSNELSAFA